MYVKGKACCKHRGTGDQITSRREHGGKGMIEAQIEERNADRAGGDRETELFYILAERNEDIQRLKHCPSDRRAV